MGTAVLDPTTLGFVLLPGFNSPAIVGSQPQNTLLGDFNNDGKLDLAATNGNANTVSVLLGNGDGTFQPQTAYDALNAPIAIVSGDFNRDGNLDLAVGDNGVATISVYLGNGDGTFLPQQTYTVGNSPLSIAAADFDGDGLLDLAVMGRNDHNVTVLLGQGDGTFQVERNVCEDLPALRLTSGRSIRSGHCDGRLQWGRNHGPGRDRCAERRGGRSAGNGRWNFPASGAYGVRFNPIGLAIADFNKDGIPDLAVANLESNLVSVLLGVGDGTFQPQVTYATGRSRRESRSADFNGDGNMDLVVSNGGSNTVSVLLGNGDGTFKTQLVFPTGARPFGMAVGDLNGDGLPDVVAPNSNVTTTSILLSAQTETAIATGQAVFGTGSHEVIATYPGDTDRRPSESDSVELVTIPQVIRDYFAGFAQSGLSRTTRHTYGHCSARSYPDACRHGELFQRDHVAGNCERRFFRSRHLYHQQPPHGNVKPHRRLFRQHRFCRFDFDGPERYRQPADRHCDRAASLAESGSIRTTGHSDRHSHAHAGHSGGNRQLLSREHTAGQRERQFVWSGSLSQLPVSCRARTWSRLSIPATLPLRLPLPPHWK